MKKIDSKIANKRLTGVVAMVLATCFVIGLLSSTAIKLVSATLYMKNSAIKTTSSAIAGIAQNLGLPVEPVQPSEDTPVISIGDATDNAGNTATGTTDNKVEDTTGATADNNTDTSTGDAVDTTTPSDSTGSSDSTDSSDTTDSTDSSDSSSSDDSSSSSSILDSIMGILGSLGVGGSGGSGEGETDAPAEEEQDPGSTKVDITNAEALKTYNTVVNSTKVKMPAFVKTTTRSADFIASFIARMNPEYFVEDQVVEVPGKTANTELCIDNNKVSACLLTSADADAVKSASKVILADGNVKLVITLNDEENPVPLEENALASDSYTSAMFPVTTADNVKAMVNNAIGSDVGDTSLLYKNCTATLIYNPKTGEIISLNQTTSYTASIQTSLFPVEFTVTEVTDYTDFVY